MRANETTAKIRQVVNEVEASRTPASCAALWGKLWKLAVEIYPGNPERYERSQVAVIFGALGGASRSPAKTAASRRNLAEWHRRKVAPHGRGYLKPKPQKAAKHETRTV
jgi:hypothetical protein